jgi:hypothetical protein
MLKTNSETYSIIKTNHKEIMNPHNLVIITGSNRAHFICIFLPINKAATLSQEKYSTTLFFAHCLVNCSHYSYFSFHGVENYGVQRYHVMYSPSDLPFQTIARRHQ